MSSRRERRYWVKHYKSNSIQSGLKDLTEEVASDLRSKVTLWGLNGLWKKDQGSFSPANLKYKNSGSQQPPPPRPGAINQLSHQEPKQEFTALKMIRLHSLSDLLSFVLFCFCIVFHPDSKPSQQGDEISSNTPTSVTQTLPQRPWTQHGDVH